MPEFDIQSIVVSDPPTSIRLRLGDRAFQGLLELHALAGKTNQSTDFSLSSGAIIRNTVDGRELLLEKKDASEFTGREVTELLEKATHIYRMPKGWVERTASNILPHSLSR